MICSTICSLCHFEIVLPLYQFVLLRNNKFWNTSISWCFPSEVIITNRLPVSFALSQKFNFADWPVLNWTQTILWNETRYLEEWYQDGWTLGICLVDSANHKSLHYIKERSTHCCGWLYTLQRDGEHQRCWSETISRVLQLKCNITSEFRCYDSQGPQWTWARSGCPGELLLNFWIQVSFGVFYTL